MLGAGEEPKEMSTEARELEASVYEFHKAPGSLLLSLLPLPVLLSISELIPNSKTKVPSQVAKKNSCQIQQSTH